MSSCAVRLHARLHSWGGSASSGGALAQRTTLRGRCCKMAEGGGVSGRSAHEAGVEDQDDQREREKKDQWMV